MCTFSLFLSPDFTLDLSVIPPNELPTHDIDPQHVNSQKQPYLAARPENNYDQAVNQKLEKEQGYTKVLPDSLCKIPPHQTPHLVPNEIQSHAEKLPDLHPQFHTEHAQFPTEPAVLVGGKAPSMGVSIPPGEFVNLSTITEESENYKNSTCSSRSTLSSGSSRSVRCSMLHMMVFACSVYRAAFKGVRVGGDIYSSLFAPPFSPPSLSHSVKGL